ncbi:MAG: alpha/beta hydrolase [Pseudomonadota bacterium]
MTASTLPPVERLTAATLSDFIKERASSRADLSLAERRAIVDENATTFPTSPDIEIAPVDAAGVSCEWQTPPGIKGNKCLLYFHGGGYAFGSAKSHRHLTSKIAQLAGMRCLSVNYRLAPENPFPAPVDDALTVYRWLLDQGIAAGNIALGGDSAGGGLAVALMLKARDEGLPLPSAAVLLCPWTDLGCDRPSYTSRAQVDPSITQAGIQASAKAYLNGADIKTPLASPVYANLAGLPPCLVQVGEREVLVDDARDLVAGMRRGGTTAELEVWDGMVHVWHAFHPILKEGLQAVQRGADFLCTNMKP